MTYNPTDIPDIRDLPDAKPLVEAIRVDQQKIRQAFVPDPVTAPTLLNSWVNYGGDVENAGYWTDPIGDVRLRGTVKNGTLPGAVFTLPAGRRPPKRLLFSVASNGAFGEVDIYPDGTVYAAIGSNVYLSLDGISFRAA